MTVRNTSLDVYYNLVLPNLSDRHFQVMRAFQLHGNFTNKELADFLHLPINYITPRTYELCGKKEGDKKFNPKYGGTPLLRETDATRDKGTVITLANTLF